MNTSLDNCCELAGTVIGEGTVRCKARPFVDYRVRFTLQVVHGEGEVARLLCSVAVPREIQPSQLADELEGRRVRLKACAVALADADPDRREGVMFVASSWHYEAADASPLPFTPPAASAEGKPYFDRQMAAAGEKPDEL